MEESVVMLSIIYTYRNRDVHRVKRSLDSLLAQTSTFFRVEFVDYGSTQQYSEQVKNLCNKYDFVNYEYRYTEFQPWNKSRALNSVIKNLDSGYCFVADVDMIFHPDFVQTAVSLQDPSNAVYFQVGFLEEKEELKNKTFFDFKNYSKSTFEATGLTMFPVEALKKLRGFDEFFHFWGAEDTDMHERLKNAGYKIQFYDEMVLLLHQWHLSYRSSEEKKISKELQINGIARFNHEHLKFNKVNNITIANTEIWGECTVKEDYDLLERLPVTFQISNKQWEIDHLIFHIITIFSDNFKVRIHTDDFRKSGKFMVKKIAGKTVPEYYNLKQINDKLILHLISFYRNRPYIYRVSDNLDYIEFAIKKAD